MPIMIAINFFNSKEWIVEHLLLGDFQSLPFLHSIQSGNTNLKSQANSHIIHQS